ncbi:MAG: pantoate--beta-alanine ligase [Gemmatimonadales bacterium]|nr:pantoate--beta-alanine ligase [Gemmatimonadales bacterium]
MQEFEAIESIRQHLGALRSTKRTIALVPTMGALHQGHLALVAAARESADIVVLSIFVNPLQFLPGEDLARYPRPLEHDRALADAHGVDILFVPRAEEMYHGTPETRVVPGATADRWEGAHRPGHFAGVLTVVAKLLNIVQPHVAVFGQKDIQQVTLVRRMVADLDIPVALVSVVTVREADGLALSSRNVFLSETDRSAALAIPRALAAMRGRWADGERDGRALERVAATVFAGTPRVKPDYIAVVDPDQLAPVEHAAQGTVAAVAARVGSTRLIDNIIFGEEPG